MIEKYNIEEYTNQIKEKGVNKTWRFLLSELSKYDKSFLDKTFFNLDDLGYIYEYGLAIENKIEKKEMGKYFTPKDVADIMSKLLLEEKVEKLVDPGCGTGNLICEVIKNMYNISKVDIVKLIKNKNLYLYDIDETAIDICVFKINKIIGQDLTRYINIVKGDFLSNDICLPKNCSVITNPPYSLIKKFEKNWNISEVARQSREMYASFLDKIMDYADNIVIVSPQSFIVSDKFELLRKKMNSNFKGEIYSFDNVPGTLFNGRKHGIFNSNKGNSVRASITKMVRIEEKDNLEFNFRLTKLIRFSTAQRNKVINIKYLKSLLNKNLQNLIRPSKYFNSLEDYAILIEKNSLNVADMVDIVENDQNKKYALNISTSARYFISASKREVDRNGCFVIYAKNEEYFYILYSLLNSSYFYMWWRYYDGGILFSKRNFFNTPIPKDVSISDENKKWIRDNIIKKEENYLSYKVNAGKKQESVKIPQEQRDKLNRIIFDASIAEEMKNLHKNREDF